LKLTTDRHEVSRGLFATAELLVGNCWTVIVSIGSLFLHPQLLRSAADRQTNQARQKYNFSDGGSDNNTHHRRHRRHHRYHWRFIATGVVM